MIIGSSDGFVGAQCSPDCVYYLSQDGVTWAPLPLPAAAVAFFTADGHLMVGDVATAETTTLTTWRWDNGTWDVAESGTFDVSACGPFDPRDGTYYESVPGITVASVGQVNWQTSATGWQCAAGPHIAFTGGHGMFVGTGSADVNSAAEYFWTSADGLHWVQGQDSSAERVATVADGFVGYARSGFSAPSNLVTSTDGMIWQPQQAPFADVYVERLASDGNRAVVIEGSDQPNTKAPGAIWVSSSNGVDWIRYQLPPKKGDYADKVAIWGNRLVVTGTAYDPGSGLIWTAQIP